MRGQHIGLMAYIIAASGYLMCNETVHAAELKREKDSLLVTGTLTPTDWDAIDLNGVKTIVFQRSLGGSVAAYRKYIEIIRQNHLATRVSGKCYSACAIAFLAGTHRDADTRNGIAAIMFHVARMQTSAGPRAFDKNPQVMETINELTSFKLPQQVREMIGSSWGEAAGVMFMLKPGFLGQYWEVRYCDGSQGANISKCQEIKGLDPTTIGIIDQ